MPKKKEKIITYNIGIDCQINEFGAVIPFGAHVGVTSDGRDQNILDFPDVWTIVMIWIGKYYQYPTIETKKGSALEKGFEDIAKSMGIHFVDLPAEKES